MSQYSDRLEELKSEENSLPPILNTLRNDLSEQTLRLEKEKKGSLSSPFFKILTLKKLKQTIQLFMKKRLDKDINSKKSQRD